MTLDAKKNPKKVGVTVKEPEKVGRLKEPKKWGA